MSAPPSDRAIAAAVAFLAERQLADGSFRVLTSKSPRMEGPCDEDPSLFPMALMAHCLSFCPSAERMAARLLDFLLAEMDRHGLWRHWTRAHPNHAQLPPDLDDTSCASAALARAGRDFPDNRPLLLANRRSDGLFHTWLIPRLRWTGFRHVAATLPQLLHPPTLWLFFRRTSAAPGDVDAVVNANVLFYLGRDEATAPVAAFLAQVLRDGGEARCDKWYENRYAVWYFLSRALGPDPVAADIVAGRIGSGSPDTALEAALAVCALANFELKPRLELIDRLLDSQLGSGGWPRAALYHGGRARRRDGGFDPRHPDTPHWGSEELTTAFAIEALSRAGGATA